MINKKTKFWSYLYDFKNRFRITSTSLVIILAILFLITLRLTFLFVNKYHLSDDPKGNIRIEIIKSLLSVLVVGIIGTTVTALFKAHERNLEESKIRVQTKIKSRNRLSKLYNRIKSSRRELYAEGLRHENGIVSGNFHTEQIELYKKEMKKINDIQLELEGMAEVRENNDSDKQIAPYLRSMEDYLNVILDEYKKLRQEFKNNGENVSLEKSPCLIEFTSSPKVDELHFKNSNETVSIKKWKRFKKDFSNSYHMIMGI